MRVGSSSTRRVRASAKALDHRYRLAEPAIALPLLDPSAPPVVADVLGSDVPNALDGAQRAGTLLDMASDRAADAAALKVRVHGHLAKPDKRSARAGVACRPY